MISSLQNPPRSFPPSNPLNSMPFDFLSLLRNQTKRQTTTKQAIIKQNKTIYKHTHTSMHTINTQNQNYNIQAKDQ